jgi:hypothetical protein
MTRDVEMLKADCSIIEDQKKSDEAIVARKNACVASVNSVYQTMRNEERGREELKRSRKRLQEVHDTKNYDDLAAKCKTCLLQNYAIS